MKGKIKKEKNPSYIFRGEEVNNYLELDERMWRIFKIDRNNNIYVSTTSLWEIAIKVQIKKLNLGLVNIYHLPNIIEQYDFTIINPEDYDYISYASLPTKENHRDPFDRMLIHMAIRNNLVVLSCDASFKQYEANGLQLLWD